MGTDALALGRELVSEDQDQVDRNSKVSSDECRVISAEITDENIKVLGQCNQDAEEQGDVRAPDAQRCVVRHDIVGDALSLTGATEGDVGDENGDPGQETKDGRQVDKVGEDLLGVIRHVHECQKTEAS